MSPQNSAEGGASAPVGGDATGGPKGRPCGGGGAPSTNGDEDEIPIIDLSEPDADLLIEQLYKACSTWGFFQLVNHGVSPELLSSFQAAMGDFFALPYETKAKLKRHAKNARGYFDDELTKRRRDWKEALDVGVPGGRDWNLDDLDEMNACLDGYNQFPSGEECPKFREVVVEYFEECSKLSDRLARLMALALGDEEGDFLDRMRGDHTSYLRMNYYPPSDAHNKCSDSEYGDKSEENLHNNTFSNQSAGEGTLGISPHRDAGFLTILLQDYDCHSLQVARFEDDDHLDDDDKWVTVHPVPGSLTINTGDMAMICSNGRFRAPLHRVLTDPTKKRYSAPYFYNPGYNELISPFDCCCTPRIDNDERNEKIEESTDGKDIIDGKLQPAKYHPCLWGYFRALRFAGDLTDLGVEIQTSHFRVGSESDHIEKQGRFMDIVDFGEPFDVDKYRHILESQD